MFLLNTTEKLLVLVFLVMTMLSIGMQTRVSDLRFLATSKGFLVRTLLANFVAVPIAGVVIALLLPLQPLVAGALVLLACTPGGVSSVQFTSKVKGSVPLAGASLFLLSLLAVFISPVLLQLALPGKVQIVVPHGRIVLFLLVYLLLPLVAGMFLIDREPGVAVKLSRPVALAGVAAFVVFMVVTRDWRKMATGEVGMAGVGAMLLFILVSLAIGWFMGGPTHESRQILATSTSMRNAALCLAIVQSSAPGHAVMVPLIAFSLLMVPPNMLFTLYHAIQGKRKARKALLSQN